MAKNIFQTKKRVSHFQKTSKQFEGENELLGCKDYVSSIIQGMDSNFGYIQSGFFNASKNHSETQDFESIPLLTFPEPSSSNSTLPIPAKAKRTKSFSLSRKFPLMEKTQKTLKQLKHNQNIPKPRAHLARIPKSPAKSKAKFIIPKLSSAKKKDIVSAKNKVSNIQCNVPSNHSFKSSAYNCLNKTSKNGVAPKHSNSEKIKDNISARSLSRNSNISNKETNKIKNKPVKSSLMDNPDVSDSNNETNCVIESDDGTSDSEYERFVKKSKKGLPKKSSKRQKVNKRKSHSCAKSSKRKKEVHVSEQKDAHNCDNVTESFTNSTGSNSKKPSYVQPDADLENNLSYSDHDIADMPIRDSSSESDDDSIATSRTAQNFSKSCEVEPVSETTVLSCENSSKSLPNFNTLESNKNPSISDHETQIINPVQHAVKNVDEKEISSASDMPQFHESLYVAETNIISGKVQNEICMKSIKTECNSLKSSLVIDICDSDDERSNGKLNPPKSSCSENVSCTVENPSKSLADSDSEESDLEIIEEVLNPVQTVDKYSASVLDNASGSLKDTASKKNLAVPNACIDVKPLIKTENSSILPVVINQKEAKIKQDVVYKTEICHTEKLEHKTIVSSGCSRAQNVSSDGSFPANSDSTVVKHEIESDDDIIILDSMHSTKVANALNLSCAKKENIKSEPSDESKLKLPDSVNSEFGTNKTNDWGKKFQNVIPVSSEELYKWYKMEYDTYLEMKRAKGDVETSLKNLQVRQAEKMLYVRELFFKAVKDNPDVKPPTGSALNSLPESSKNSNSCTSVNIQNNSDISPNNSLSLNSQVILLSSVEQDVKPDISKPREGMQSINPKTEVNQDGNSKKIIPKVESDDKQTLKLLTEKCSVCGKDAVAACQRCAKVFFCSHECGRKFWIEGHVKVCGTK